MEWSHPAVVLGVNVSPGLEQVGNVREASLLTSGVVEGGPSQPLKHCHHGDIGSSSLVTCLHCPVSLLRLILCFLG